MIQQCLQLLGIRQQQSRASLLGRRRGTTTATTSSTTTGVGVGGGDNANVAKYIIGALVLIILVLAQFIYFIFSTYNIPIYTSSHTSISVNGGNSASYAYRQLKYPEYLDGSLDVKVTKEARQESDRLSVKRRSDVRDAMKHHWNGYSTYAMGRDELKPLSKSWSDEAFGGLSATLFDAIDTLWVMDLKEEFYHARNHVRDHVDFSRIDTGVSTFEATIRILGGLLGAYDCSKDKVFLRKADELGSRLTNAFVDKKFGIPEQKVDLNKAVHDFDIVDDPEQNSIKSSQRIENDAEGDVYNDFSKDYAYASLSSNIAEAGTLQLEFRYLSEITGNAEYKDLVMKIFDNIIKEQPTSGLFPVTLAGWSDELSFTDRITFGARGDTFYQYLLKVWLQSNQSKQDLKYREAYDRAIEGLHEKLLHQSSPSRMFFLSQLLPERLDDMEHLACSVGGLLALGAYTDPNGRNSKRAKRDLRTSRALTYTCYQMYERTVTGLAGEVAKFRDGVDFVYSDDDARFLLRPETIESLYILHEITGDPTYREWGWDIFKAIEVFCKTEFGYASVHGIQNTSPYQEDHVDSYFMGATLKYLYLLFGGGEFNMLDRYVFSAKGHILEKF